jgi:hypothetical protein
MQKMIATKRLGAVLATASVAALGATTPALAKSHTPSNSSGPSNKALLKDIHKVTEDLASAVTSITKTTTGLTASVKTLTTGLAATNATVAQVQAAETATDGKVTGLTSALASGSAQVTAALTQINTALNDSSTGLVGLNNARPRFAIVAFPGGAATLAGSTPEKTVTIAAVAAGTTIVNFNEDVSKRALTVTTAPGAPSFGEAVDCANAGGACPGGDIANTDVLVTTWTAANIGGGPANEAFTLTALAG